MDKAYNRSDFIELSTTAAYFQAFVLLSSQQARCLSVRIAKCLFLVRASVARKSSTQRPLLCLQWRSKMHCVSCSWSIAMIPQLQK